MISCLHNYELILRVIMKVKFFLDSNVGKLSTSLSFPTLILYWRLRYEVL